MKGPAGVNPAGPFCVCFSGDGNLILDNTLLILRTGTAQVAISIGGTGNIIRGNLVPPPSVFPWEAGIVFFQDGNFYGDNIISAEVPFDLQGTVQIDLGGNVGL